METKQNIASGTETTEQPHEGNRKVQPLVLKLIDWLNEKGCRVVRHHSCQHITIQEHRKGGWTTLAYGSTVEDACEMMEELGKF